MAPPKATRQQGGAAASVQKPELRQPVFVKIGSLIPKTSGHTVIVEVISSKTVVHRLPGGRHQRLKIAECLVGDETSTILLTARDNQVELMQPGNTVILRNAKIAMFQGSMRLTVGLVEVTGPAKFVVKEDNNLSSVEYELVNLESDSTLMPLDCSIYHFINWDYGIHVHLFFFLFRARVTNIFNFGFIQEDCLVVRLI